MASVVVKAYVVASTKSVISRNQTTSSAREAAPDRAITSQMTRAPLTGAVEPAPDASPEGRAASAGGATAPEWDASAAVSVPAASRRCRPRAERPTNALRAAASQKVACMPMAPMSTKPVSRAPETAPAVLTAYSVLTCDEKRGP